MRRYSKEIAALLIQLLIFYLLPLFAGPTDTMGMVLIMLLSAFALGLLLGGLSGNLIKHLFPAAIAVVFIPSVWIYYNESALIHAVWYFVSAEAGMLLSSAARKLIK